MSEVITFNTEAAVKKEGYLKVETYFLVDETDPILKEKIPDFDNQAKLMGL